MIWRIIFYNGTIWTSRLGDSLVDAIALFIKNTELSQVDIKKVENLS